MKTSSQKPIPILTFHKVDPSFEWGVTRVTPQQFKRILLFLRNDGYETISLCELFEPSKNLPQKPVVITFDDSYESLYIHAFPLMREFGFRGTIFIVARYSGMMNTWDVNLGGKSFRHLSWIQIRELYSAGFEMGSHTMTHPDLTRVSPNRLHTELKESKEILEDRIGKPIRFISFPYGRYNHRVVEACKQHGYVRACGFWIKKNDKKNKETFVLERKAYYLLDSLWNLKSKLNKTSWTPFEEGKLRIVNFCSHASALIKPSKAMKTNSEE